MKTNLMKKFNKSQKGFTLIELLVVIAIIGLLSTLAVVALNNARAKSRDAKRIADVKQMQTALEMYFAECDGYPTHQSAAGTAYENDANYETLLTTAVYNDGTNDCSVAFGQFMPQIPEPPTPTDNDTECATTDGWEGNIANTYYYSTCNAAGTCDGTGSNLGASYTLEYCLGGATGGLSGGLHYANPAGMQ